MVTINVLFINCVIYDGHIECLADCLNLAFQRIFDSIKKFIDKICTLVMSVNRSSIKNHFLIKLLRKKTKI